MACGGDISTQVPLAYVYRLAERLARAWATMRAALEAPGPDARTVQAWDA